MEAKNKKKEKCLVSDMHTNIGIVLKFFYQMKPMHSRAYQTCNINILYVCICTLDLSSMSGYLDILSSNRWWFICKVTNRDVVFTLQVSATSQSRIAFHLAADLEMRVVLQCSFSPLNVWGIFKTLCKTYTASGPPEHRYTVDSMCWHTKGKQHEDSSNVLFSQKSPH